MPDGPHSAATVGGQLPPQVEMLAPRERDLATLIYRRGPMTAKDIEQSLGHALSNSSIRSMLERLVRKKILKRRKRPIETKSSGKRIAFLYLPALDDDAVKQSAVRQVARDFFGGSLLELREAADDLLGQTAARQAKATTAQRAAASPHR